MKLILIAAATLAALATSTIATPTPPHRNAINSHQHQPPQQPQGQPHHSPEPQSEHSAADVDVVDMPTFASHEGEHDHVARLHLMAYNENMTARSSAVDAATYTGDYAHWFHIKDKHKEALRTAGEGHRTHREAQSRQQRTQETSQIRADAQRAWDSILAAKRTKFAAELAMKLATVRRQRGHSRRPPNSHH